MGKPEGRFGVWMVGHRNYVGGLWDEIGLLQFEFLKSRGLKPHHVLVDIACGSLRAGVQNPQFVISGSFDFEAFQKRP